jgi:hypothetical protein
MTDRSLLFKASASLVIAAAVGIAAMPRPAHALSYDECVDRLSNLFYKKGDTWPDAVDKAKKRCSYYTAPKKKSGRSATGSFSN